LAHCRLAWIVWKLIRRLVSIGKRTIHQPNTRSAWLVVEFHADPFTAEMSDSFTVHACDPPPSTKMGERRLRRRKSPSVSLYR